MQINVITGGAGGIGAAIGQRLGKRGERVILADIEEAAGESARREIGSDAEFLNLDVSDSSSWSHLREETILRHGHIDTLILNAGVMSGPRGAAIDGGSSLQWLTRDAYERVMSVNQEGVVNGLLAFLPTFLEQGAGQIVVVSSVDAVIPYPQDPFYAMTKASQLSLVRSLAPALSQAGVTINAICPYAVSTELTPANFRDVPGRGMPASEFAEAVDFVLESTDTGQVWLKHPLSRDPSLYDFAPVPGVDRLY